MMEKKPRIAEIITRLIRGGAQEGTLLITKRLLEEGCSVAFIHGPGDFSLLDKLPKDHPDLKIVFIPEFRRRILPVQDLLALVRLYRYFRKNPIDLVHTHTSKAGVLGRWAAWLAKVPVIIHSPRGSIYHKTYYPKPALCFFAFIERITAKVTHKIITLCESEKQDYIQYKIAGPEKFTTIYSGSEVKQYLDCQVDIEKKKKELSIPLGRPVIGYVSRMTPEKGHFICVEAFQKVREKKRNAVLVLVGEGPLESAIRKAVADRQLKDSVFFTGVRRDIAEVLRTFDCFLQTSLWDGLPRAMIEAMLSELPVIATAVGGVPEIIHNKSTGILVDGKDVSGLAEAVVDILDHPDKAKALGKQARKRMEDVYDIGASVDKLFALYGSLLESRHTIL